MNRQGYNSFQRLVHQVASSRWGASLFSRVLHHVDRLYVRLRPGRRPLSAILSGLPEVVVTTTGAKSGLPRTVTLLYIRDGDERDRFALVASNWGQHSYPAWYFNLKANPVARCVVDGQEGTYRA
jgi:hypothetical protein